MHTADNECRRIRISPNAIWHMIEAQAGTLAKALCELVTNSLDAGATRVDVTLASKQFVVRDDGRGFATKAEIDKWFDDLCFDHTLEGNQRQVGKFGMGRAQAWAFSSTVWRTGSFRMTVDVKRNGLDYDLDSGLDLASGCEITGSLYEKMSLSDVEMTSRELTDLVRYLAIPVYLNDKLLTKNPNSEKWTHITEEAYIRLRPTGDLEVFNLGMLVRAYPHHMYGVGGVIVSRMPLLVNGARNDVLVAKCPIWKRLRTQLTKEGVTRNTKSSRLTANGRQFLVQNMLSGDVALDREGERLKLITAINGAAVSIQQFAAAVSFGKLPVTTAQDDGDRVGERLHQQKIAFVLSHTCLEQWRVDTPRELINLLQLLRQQSVASGALHPAAADCWFHNVQIEDINTLSSGFNTDYTLIDKKSLNADEQACLDALQQSSFNVLVLLDCTFEERQTVRRLVAGDSDIAEAWTDGKTYIALRRSLLGECRSGLGGFLRIAGVLLHEYLHDQQDSCSHQHDHMFYERFHNAILSSNCYTLGSVANAMLDRYLTNLRKSDRKVPLRALRSLDRENEVRDRGETHGLPDASENSVRTGANPIASC